MPNTSQQEKLRKEFADFLEQDFEGLTFEQAMVKTVDWWLDKLESELHAREVEREPEMNRKLQATMMWIADYAYRKANPEGKRDTPSIVYEQVAKDFGQFWDSLTPVGDKREIK